MPSEKTKVIEWIFFHRKFDTTRGELTDPIVTMEDINAGITATSANLVIGANRANFWKDLTRRGAKSLNKNWPTTVFAHGFTGRDAIGNGPGAVLMFVPTTPGQKAAFIEDVDDLVFNHQLPVTQLQSLSMPEAMKALGRSGENWHAQVVDRLNVVSTFFALHSPRNTFPRRVREVNFLQTGIKLNGGETDAAFSLIADDGRWLVSAEAKGKREQFNLSQIARSSHALEKSVRRAKHSNLGDIAGVIPLGIKVVDRSKLWVVEFDPVSDPSTPLRKKAEGVFELVPHVPGVE